MPGHSRWQGKGQIHQCIEQTFAGELVVHQHIGQQEAEGGVEKCCESRSAYGHTESGQGGVRTK